MMSKPSSVARSTRCSSAEDFPGYRRGVGEMCARCGRDVREMWASCGRDVGEI